MKENPAEPGQQNLQAFVSEYYGKLLASVLGSRTTHFGVYPCGPTMAAVQYRSTVREVGGACC